MVIFAYVVFGKIGMRKKLWILGEIIGIDGLWYLPNPLFPKTIWLQIPKNVLISFLGIAFGELVQSVPTGEDCQHEEEELQGSM